MRFILIAILIPALISAVPKIPNRLTFPEFISGDLFREHADFAFDSHDQSMRPELVKPGDTVFVQSDILKNFFRLVHPAIQCPYILITHNSDVSAPGQYFEYLDDPKLIAWFGENYDGYEHPKMHVIPMGTANFNRSNGKGDVLKRVIAKKMSKEHLAHMGFTIQTYYDERWGVFRQFSEEPFVYRTVRKVYEGYLTDMNASKFEIAPRGYAYDTYRLWECLYVGTIPVVRTSPLDGLYEGLPVLIVQDWKEATEEFLEKKYLEFSEKTFNMEKTTMAYWQGLIQACSIKFRQEKGHEDGEQRKAE